MAKTAKEILKSDDDFIETLTEIEEALIIERMELYANQFKPPMSVKEPVELKKVEAAADKFAARKLMRDKILIDAINRLLPLARDGRRLHVSNGVHQEFLKEDDEDISFATEALSQYRQSVEATENIMIDKRSKAQYERWPMATPDEADRYHQMFMEFGLGFEKGWKAAGQSPQTAPTSG